VDKSFVVDCDAMPEQRGDGAFAGYRATISFL
jgi:hypothetical protein